MSEIKNELTITEGFAALANRDVLNEAMMEDCQGLEFSFDRVKLPAGGGTAFEIPSADGEESEMAKEIKGVIVYNHPAFAYYQDKYTGGSNPPDCGSFDGVRGLVTPVVIALPVHITDSEVVMDRASSVRTSVSCISCVRANFSQSHSPFPPVLLRPSRDM